MSGVDVQRASGYARSMGGAPFTSCPYCGRRVDPNDDAVTYGIAQATTPGFGELVDVDGTGAFFLLAARWVLPGPADTPQRRADNAVVLVPRRTSSRTDRLLAWLRLSGNRFRAEGRSREGLHFRGAGCRAWAHTV